VREVIEALRVLGVEHELMAQGDGATSRASTKVRLSSDRLTQLPGAEVVEGSAS